MSDTTIQYSYFPADMERFMHILYAEADLYSQMEICLNEKTQVIIQRDLPALVAVDTQLEKLTQRIKTLEKERVDKMGKLGFGNAKLNTIINRLQNSRDQQALTQIHRELKLKTETVQRLSQSNRDLLTQSIRFIEQSIQFIASKLSPEGASYSNRRNVMHQNNTQNDVSNYTGSFATTISRDA